MENGGDRVERFRDLHRKGRPLLLANVWDAGSARLLESLGYEALATTSSGHAGTLGRLDGGVPAAPRLGSSEHSASNVEPSPQFAVG